ncbi:MAG: hypothetical protein HY518_02185 [Candidatus Aenigmarchaeota archaeon]|nr:hypothetical protein [Candidatus Aenigmarchaeota archaeon]
MSSLIVELKKAERMHDAGVRRETMKGILENERLMYSVLNTAIEKPGSLSSRVSGLAARYKGLMLLAPKKRDQAYDCRLGSLEPGWVLPDSVENLRTVSEDGLDWVRDKLLSPITAPYVAGAALLAGAVLFDADSTAAEYANVFRAGVATGLVLSLIDGITRYVSVKNMLRSAAYIDQKIEELYR